VFLRRKNKIRVLNASIGSVILYKDVIFRLAVVFGNFVMVNMNTGCIMPCPDINTILWVLDGIGEVSSSGKSTSIPTTKFKDLRVGDTFFYAGVSSYIHIKTVFGSIARSTPKYRQKTDVPPNTPVYPVSKSPMSVLTAFTTVSVLTERV